MMMMYCDELQMLDWVLGKSHTYYFLEMMDCSSLGAMCLINEQFLEFQTSVVKKLIHCFTIWYEIVNNLDYYKIFLRDPKPFICIP